MDEPWVDELDMPSRAYFIIPLDSADGGRQQQVIAAHEIRSGPFETHEQAETFSKLAISRVHQELLTLGGGIIWWRIRPEVNNDIDGPEKWHFYARCGTSPTLPNSFWSEMGDRGV